MTGSEIRINFYHGRNGGVICIISSYRNTELSSGSGDDKNSALKDAIRGLKHSVNDVIPAALAKPIKPTRY